MDRFDRLLQIFDNQVYQPTVAVLKPNERVTVKMIYSYAIIGCHSFPVVLSISGGRQIPLQLTGITLRIVNQLYFY